MARRTREERVHLASMGSVQLAGPKEFNFPSHLYDSPFTTYFSQPSSIGT